MADHTDWLIEHFHRYRKRDAHGQHDGRFMAAYRRRLEVAADARGWTEEELLAELDAYVRDPDGVAGGS